MNHPGTEIRVESWQELNNVLHAPPIVQHKFAEGGHLRSPYVFRGMDVASWDLDSSLRRLPGINSSNIEVLENR